MNELTCSHKSLLSKINLFLIFIVLNVFDYLTTKYVVSQLGYQAELNPIIRSLIKYFGNDAILFAKMIVIITMWFAINYIRPNVLWVANIIYLFIVLNNFYVVYSL